MFINSLTLIAKQQREVLVFSFPVLLVAKSDPESIPKVIGTRNPRSVTDSITLHTDSNKGHPFTSFLKMLRSRKLRCRLLTKTSYLL